MEYELTERVTTTVVFNVDDLNHYLVARQDLLDPFDTSEEADNRRDLWNAACDALFAIARTRLNEGPRGTITNLAFDPDWAIEEADPELIDQIRPALRNPTKNWAIRFEIEETREVA